MFGVKSGGQGGCECCNEGARVGLLGLRIWEVWLGAVGWRNEWRRVARWGFGRGAGRFVRPWPFRLATYHIFISRQASYLVIKRKTESNLWIVLGGPVKKMALRTQHAGDKYVKLTPNLPHPFSSTRPKRSSIVKNLTLPTLRWCCYLLAARRKMTREMSFRPARLLWSAISTAFSVQFSTWKSPL